MKSAMAILMAVVHRFLSHHGFMLAAALSYSLLICLAPLVLLVFSVAGFVLTSEQVAQDVLASVTDLFPGSGPEMHRLLAVLTRERRVTGLLGMAGLLLASTQLFSMLRTVTNTAFEVTKRRTLVRGFAFDVLFAGLLGLLGVMVAAGLLVGLTLADLGRDVLPDVAMTAWFRRVTVVNPLLLLLLFLIYRTTPNVKVPVRSAVVAAVVVGASWETARWLLTTQIAHVARYGRLYGSLGVVVAALVWIYYSSVLFVLGAELVAVLTGRSEGAGGRRRERPVDP